MGCWAAWIWCALAILSNRVVAAQPGDVSEKRAAARSVTEEARRLFGHRTAASLRQAIVAGERCASMWRELSDSEMEAECLEHVGRSHRLLNQQDAAMPFFLRALELTRSVHDRLGEGQALASLGLVAQDKGDAKTALDHYQAAVEIFHATGSLLEEGRSLNNIALIYSQQGDQNHAIEFFNKSLALARSTMNRELEAITLQNLAVEHKRAGEFNLALDYNQQALRVFRTLGNGRGEADCLTNIGNVYAELGEPVKGLETLQQALTVRRKIGDRRGEAIALANIGAILTTLHNPQEAIRYHEDSLAIRQDINDLRGQAQVLNNLGSDYLELRDTKKAVGYYQRALGITRQLGDRGLEGTTQHFVGVVHAAAGENKEALECFRDALRLLEPAGQRAAMAGTLYEVAKVLRSDHQLTEALSQIDAALDIQEGIRKNSPANELRSAYFGSVREQYEYRVDLLMALGLTQEAFETSERARARSLLDILSRGREPEPMTLADIQNKLLDRDTVLLQYLLGNQRSFLWVITAESCKAWTLPKRTDLDAAARRAYAEVISGSGRSGLAELSKILLPAGIGPLGRKRLLIAAEEALQYIPFGALPGVLQEHEVVHLPSASIVAALRTRAAGRSRAPESLLVMADPVFTADDPRVGSAGQRPEGEMTLGADLGRSVKDLGLTSLYRLRSTRREAEEIAALVSFGGRRIALDFEASRALALSPEISRYRVVHMATHALLNTVHPEASGIVLSLVDQNGKPREGFLRVSDIYDLKLNADLVVLSACQTALGKEVRGEGMIGLTRGFMFAGAPRVVSSLWRVPDRATAELMKRFYENMFQKKLPAAAALRQAQLSIRAEPKWAAPLNWAGFVLNGEWR
jgi:CHAT domain-containing protein/Tfp pilus assembly protein PilF